MKASAVIKKFIWSCGFFWVPVAFYGLYQYLNKPLALTFYNASSKDVRVKFSHPKKSLDGLEVLELQVKSTERHQISTDFRFNMKSFLRVDNGNLAVESELGWTTQRPREATIEVLEDGPPLLKLR